jgi:prepilin-type N-terminal cleavage/methylation domain-containing protein
MNTLYQPKSRGFTIIEVVLVLAIAGLILLMVFIALPALQRGQRDTARKNDVSLVASAYTTAKSNTRSGVAVTTASLKTYVTDVSENTTPGLIAVGAKTLKIVKPGEVIVVPATTCGTSGPNGAVAFVDGTPAQFTVVTQLEGGSKSGYCLNS